MAEPDWDALLIDSDEPAMSRGLTRFITSEIVRNATIGRSLARLCTEADLGVRSVVTMAPVFRDETWIEEVGAPPFLATALLFLVVAEVPA